MVKAADSVAIDSAALARRLKRLGLTGREADWADRYLLCEHVVDPAGAKDRQRFEAVARFVRDLIAHRWVKTRDARGHANPKRIHYLSMEFLIGRCLNNNIQNIAASPVIEKALKQQGWRMEQILEEEPDAGLGNGGLGRLAACFLDSLATQQYSAIGYGLRYEYGMFRQSIRDGYQVEEPDNWLRRPDPWEVARPGKEFTVPLHSTFELIGSTVRVTPGKPSTILGVAYDRPVVGYGGRCVNTLRLWAARAPQAFNLADFSHGDFAGAVLGNVAAESFTRVLYPDDSTQTGRTLRFLQEYFMVSCSLQDILSRFRKTGNSDWSAFPDHAAIQMNDTHPALAVAELMRVLIDEERLPWNVAWDVTVRTLAYTNHTLLPEALEQWPVELFELFVPRHLELIYEINRRFLETIEMSYPDDHDRRRRMSLIEEAPVRKVRMAHLAVVGSHSTNGVAAIHSALLRTHVLKDFYDAFPSRFSNKTNGVSQRRWLMAANPELAKLITDVVGAAWITNLSLVDGLTAYASDSTFRKRFIATKRASKASFADWLKGSYGHVVDPDTIFDCHIKRIHEYKRQLLNVLHIVILYNRMRKDPGCDIVPRTFFFAGKAAPAYTLAKLIIKLIGDVARTLDRDTSLRGRLRVVFLPDYNVSTAERLIPASDVSEQISTAGYEASGTSNMKFMMNGALTVGTRDGATIEMAERVGAENIFLFGLSADQVADTRAWYDPYWHYAHDPDTRDALDLIFGNHFNRDEPGIFEPIRDVLLRGGDHYLHLADLQSYTLAQAQAASAYADRGNWADKAIRNIASSGYFSSDRTIAEYAADIWNAAPSPVL